MSENHASAKNQSDVSEVAIPMKWYKFLICFFFFAAAVYNLLFGLGLMNGAQYGDSIDLMYAHYGALRTVDIAAGIYYIALAVLALFARFSLARYHISAPRLVTAFFVAGMMSSLLYNLAVCFATRDLSFNTFSPVYIAAGIALIVFNRIYFRKREHLFTNM